MRKKLAVLGASYLQLPLIIKAKLMGIEVHCFAWDNKDAVAKNTADFFYPISILDKEAILEVCKNVVIDGITSIASDICMPVVAYIAEQMGLPNYNSTESALISTNKALMRSAFKRKGVLSPLSIPVSNFDTLSDIKFDFPIIVKPTDRSGSRGVTLTKNINELKDAIAVALTESFEKQVVIEEYIEGREISVESISFNGIHYILAVTDKITTGPPYFVELEHHQPSSLSKEQLENVHRATIHCLNALYIKYGASHAEFKLDKDNNVYVIEVGARMGGDFIGSHLVELTTAYDYMKAVIDIALNLEFCKPLYLKNIPSGVVFLCQDNINALAVFEDPTTVNGLIEIKRTAHEIVSVNSSADRSGYYIYSKVEL
jgi:biotin carboxylase